MFFILGWLSGVEPEMRGPQPLVLPLHHQVNKLHLIIDFIGSYEKNQEQMFLVTVQNFVEYFLLSKKPLYGNQNGIASSAAADSQ